MMTHPISRRTAAASFIAILGALLGGPVPAADSPTYGQREDVTRFADELAQARGLDAHWLQEQLSQARYQPAVIKLIKPPPAGTAKNWAAYRSRFVQPKRVQAGVDFWNANERWLGIAQARWGVPPSIVMGILGVETFYGQQMGTFRIIDALATLAFDYPTGQRDRSAFFRDELGEFFVLTRREGLDPLQPLGSYAGAMGLPQFMPSSRNKYAVDFDGDGRIDLQASAPDAIGSIAHYLAEFGWQRGMPTHFSVAAPVEVTERATLLAPDIEPTFSVEQLVAHGALPEPRAKNFDGPLAFVELQNGDAAPSYVAATANFYAVTRYNRSAYYAMAVIELGEAVEREWRVQKHRRGD